MGIIVIVCKCRSVDLCQAGSVRELCSRINRIASFTFTHPIRITLINRSATSAQVNEHSTLILEVVSLYFAGYDTSESSNKVLCPVAAGNIPEF